MTKLKKVVALVLSVLLAFGSMSVMAAAWDPAVDDGFTTTIIIKPFRYDAEKDEWVEATKAKPGETIQTRIYLGTDYFTTTGSFVWGWSKDFFNDTMPTAKTDFSSSHLNQSATSNAVLYGMTGELSPYNSGTTIIADEVDYGHVDPSWEDDYNWAGTTYNISFQTGVAPLSTDEYYVKFDYFTVKSLEELGDVTEGTYDIPKGSFDNMYYADPGYGNFTKAEEGSSNNDGIDMYEWREDDDSLLNFSYGSVSILSDVTFDANGGNYGTDSEGKAITTYDLNGVVGNTSDVSAVPAPTAPEGQVFVGWYDASITNPDPETDVFSTGTVTHDYSDDNIDYKAYYKAADPDSVTLTFLMGEEEGAATHATLTGAPHDPLTAPADPKKAGYTFAGWSPEVPAEYPTSNVTYIAQWTANSNTAYTVKTWEMDVNGAYPTSSDQGFTGTTGTTATVTAPAKPGFTFDAAASNLSGTITGDGNLVLNLYYERNQFTVTTLDGSNGNATISTDTYYYDQDVTFTAPPKEGYSVSGWTYFNADNFSILATAPVKMPNHNVTAIVNYAANTYKVQFYGFNNADLGFQMIEYGKAATAPTAPAVTGYSFKEWDTDFSSVKSELTVKAIYEANTYKVAYYDGENLIEEIDVAYDATTVGKPAEDPTKDGYTFAGWTYQDTDGNAITDLSQRPAADFVAKANWDAIEYTITFVVDGATYHTIKADYDTVIDTSTLKQPTKEGHTFGGWSPAIPEKMPLNGATITATWNVNPYTITYVVDGATYTTQTYDFGKDVTAPENPKKDGYTFGSWTYTYVVDGATVTLDNAPATMPAHNLTATGSWVVGSANVVINIYTEDLGADTFTLLETKNDVGETESTYTYTPTEIKGFTFDAEASKVSGTITGTGLTLNVYYTRDSYNLKLAVDGEVYDTIPYEFGATVAAPAQPSKPGHTFDGWAEDVPATMPSNDVTLNATWTKNSITVTWILEDAESGSSSFTTTNDYGEELTAYELPEIAFYKTFSGWYTDPGYTTPAVFPTTYSANTAYFAKTTLKTYISTFLADTNDDGEYEFSETVGTVYGQEITPPTAPDMFGYSFDIWVGDYFDLFEDGGAILELEEDVEGLEFVASYYPNEYEVIFNLDGGNIGGDTANIKNTVEFDSVIEAPANPSKTGATFSHWELDGVRVEFTEEAPVLKTEGAEFIAIYTVNTFTVTFVDYDGTELKSETVEYGKAATAPTAPDNKEGYHFTGWDIAFDNITADTTVTAQYEINVYDIEINDPEGIIITDTKDEDGDGVIEDGEDVVIDFEFEEGYDDIEDIVVKVDGEVRDDVIVDVENGTITVPDADGDIEIIVTPKLAEYTVTFVDWDDTVLKTETVAHGSAATAPEDPTRTGYGFTGWDVAFDNITADTTVTAQYTINTYAVKFVDWDGTELKSETVDYGKAATAPADPTRTGYSFTGWDVAFDNITADTTVTAQYEINVYDITVEDPEGIDIKDVKDEDGDGKIEDGEDVVIDFEFEEGYDDIEDIVVKVDGEVRDDVIVDIENGTITVPDADGDIEIIVTPKLAEYTVTFVDYDGSVIKTETVKHGGAATAPEDPTRTGYSFTGWDVAFDNITADTTVTAQYEINTYNVTLTDSEAVDFSGAATVTHGDSYVVTYTLAEGYSSIGALTVLVGGTPVTDYVLDEENKTITINNVTGNVVVSASSTIDSFTVTFVDHDGTVLKTETVNYGGAATAPEDPSRTGYSFTGWDVAFNNITADTTVTAQYDINVYDITIEDPEGIEIKDVKDEDGDGDVEYGEDIVIDFEFEEGYDDIEDVTVIVGGEVRDDVIVDIENGTITVPDADGDIEIIVTPKLAEYTVTFVDYDGSVIKTETVEHGKAATAPEDPSRTGYSFTGWDVAFDNITADTTVTAQYDINSYDALFYADGKLHATVSTEFGKVPVAPEAPSKTGYSFTGWSPALAEMTTAGAIYTAVFKADTYNATFDLKGGNIEGDTSVVIVPTEFDKVPVAPADPSKTGYTFGGWDPALNAMDTVGGETYTAKWLADAVTITIKTFTMDTTGQYGSAETTTSAAEAGSSYTYEPTLEKGLHVNEDMSTLTSIVDPNGTTVFTVYVVREQFALITDVDGDIKSTDYYYGATVSVADPENKKGHTFAGWNPTAPETMPAENVTLVATWTPNTYTITFDTADGTAIAPITQAYGTEITAPANPTRTGYSFTGWDTEIPKTMPAGDMTITALWKADEHLATYKVDGEVYEEYTVEYGKPIPVPEDPKKDGYHFVRWSRTDTVMGTTDLVFNAIFELNEYTVTFVDYDGAVLKTETVKHGGAATAPAAPDNKANYHFTNWDVAYDNITGDTTVTAVYAIDTFTVKFVDWNGTELKSETVDYGAAATAPADPTRDGYTFAAWDVAFDNITADTTVTATYTLNTYEIDINDPEGIEIKDVKDEDGDGNIEHGEDVFIDFDFEEGYDDVADIIVKVDGEVRDDIVLDVENGVIIVPDVDGDIEIIVTPKLAEYTVTFVDYDGTVLKTETVAHGSAATAPAEPDNKANYHFANWDVAFDNITADTTVTAVYAIDTFTVKFVDWNGTELKSETVDYGAAATAPADPTRTGYTFAAWDVAFDNITADTTVTATYTVNQYTYTFVVDGTTVASGTIDYGTAIPVPEDPEKAGFEFVYWAPSVPETMPAEDVTFNAVWTDGTNTPYTINIYVMGIDGTYGEPVTTTLEGTTNSYVATKAGTITGYTADLEKSVLGGYITADGSLALKIYYARNTYTVTWIVDGVETVDEYLFGEAIIAPEDPEKDGATFLGWDATVPKAMPAENLEFTATWDDNSYTVTWIVDGEEDVDNYLYGATIVKPADPAKTGYTFTGWDAEIPATMPAEDLVFTAQFEINEYTVTFLDFDGNVFETYEAEYGANVTVPATEPAKEHYTFEGWNDVPATVPAEDIVIYPNFERITVKLVAREGSTAVIDRNGYIENAEDYAGVAGTDYEAWTEGATGWFIYGLETMLTKTELLENYIKVQGDGRIVVTATATGYGTGAVVEVYDNVTNTVVETFRIVIFGDLNGDSAVKSTDTQIMSEEVAYTTNWSRGAGAVDYLVKAADLSQDGRVEGTDRTLLVDVVLYAASIDQATGEVTYY